jgi:hypothetical protein
MLRLVQAQRVYPPETIAAMTAAFDRVGEVIPKRRRHAPTVGADNPSAG